MVSPDKTVRFRDALELSIILAGIRNEIEYCVVVQRFVEISNQRFVQARGVWNIIIDQQRK